MESPPDLSVAQPTSTHSESLSECFARLCATDQPEPSRDPPLSGLTADESRFLTRNADGEVYLTPDAVLHATGPLRPAVLSAFRKALVHAFGDDPAAKAAAAEIHANSDNSDGHAKPDQPTEDQSRKKQRSEPVVSTFAQLLGVEEFVPVQQLTTFAWADSVSKEAFERFNTTIEAERKAREEEDAAEAQRAMARAAAAAAKSTHTSRPRRRPQAKHPQSFNADPVVWAAQEEALASSVLRELRASFSRIRKGSSRAPPEGSPIWPLLSQKNNKLKPQAAAEMARAKIAAAAAAAAMREDDLADHSNESLANLNTASAPGSEANILSKNQSRSHRHTQHRQSLTQRFSLQSHSVTFSNNPGFPRALSHDSSSRLKNTSKKKRVEFAEGTVFNKQK